MQPSAIKAKKAYQVRLSGKKYVLKPLTLPLNQSYFILTSAIHSE
jgi:hypothetical protein